MNDYYQPPYVLVGAANPADANAVMELYTKVTADKHITDTRTAALVKYACNAFHVLKVTFANEIGSLAKGLGADGHAVMSLVSADRKLNVSSAYLRPGFAFGGSCLPKDLWRYAFRRATGLATKFVGVRAARERSPFEAGIKTHSRSGPAKTGHRRTEF